MPGEVGSCGRREVRRFYAVVCQGPLLLITESAELEVSTSGVGEGERETMRSRSGQQREWAAGCWSHGVQGRR